MRRKFVRMTGLFITLGVSFLSSAIAKGPPTDKGPGCMIDSV